MTPPPQPPARRNRGVAALVAVLVVAVIGLGGAAFAIMRGRSSDNSPGTSQAGHAVAVASESPAGKTLPDYSSGIRKGWSFDIRTALSGSNVRLTMDPTIEADLYQGFEVIDAGKIWVVGYAKGENYGLVGLSAETGNTQWVQDLGFVEQCVPKTLGGKIACAVKASESAASSSVVLLNPDTGKTDRAFSIGSADAIADDGRGGLLVVEQRRNGPTVTAYTTAGKQRWQQEFTDLGSSRYKTFAFQFTKDRVLMRAGYNFHVFDRSSGRALGDGYGLNAHMRGNACLAYEPADADYDEKAIPQTVTTGIRSAFPAIVAVDVNPDNTTFAQGTSCPRPQSAALPVMTSSIDSPAFDVLTIDYPGSPARTAIASGGGAIADGKLLAFYEGSPQAYDEQTGTRHLWTTSTSGAGSWTIDSILGGNLVTAFLYGDIIDEISGISTSDGSMRWHYSYTENSTSPVSAKPGGYILVVDGGLNAPPGDDSSPIAPRTTLTRLDPVSTGSQVVAKPASIPNCPKAVKAVGVRAWTLWAQGWTLVCSNSSGGYTLRVGSIGGGSGDVGVLGVPTGTYPDARAVDGGYCAPYEGGSQICSYFSPAVTQVVDKAGQPIKQVACSKNWFTGLGGGGAGKNSGAYGVTAPDDNARDEVRYLVEILQKSAAARTSLRSGVATIESCNGSYDSAITSIQSVRDNRAQLIAALRTTPVDKIANGRDLVAQLTTALEYSRQADVKFLSWAQTVKAQGCGSGKADYDAGVSLSGQASDAKKTFTSTWANTIVGTYGVEAFDEEEI